MEWYGDYSTTISREGVTVETGIDLERLPVPAVAYRISSDHDEPVGVKFEDQLPGSVTPEHVGFAPRYGSEYWRIYPDNRVVWSGTLAPNASGVTLYGVWLNDPKTVYELLEPPEIQVVDALAEASAKAGQPRGAVIEGDGRPEWWFDDAEEATKHIVDEGFSNADSPHLRRMVDDIKSVLTGAGGANYGGTAADTARAADAAESAADAAHSAADAAGSAADAVGSAVDAAETVADAAETVADAASTGETGGDGEAGGPSGDAADGEEDLSIEFPSEYDRSSDEERREAMSGVSLSRPDDGEVVDLFETGETLPRGDRYHLRVATYGTRHGTGGGESVLQELMNALTVVNSTFTPGAADEHDVLDAAVVSELGRSRIRAALDGVDRVEEIVISEVGDLPSDMEWVNEPVEPPTADAMDEFAALQAEFDQVGLDEMEDELEEMSLPGVDPDDELGFDELLDEEDLDDGSTDQTGSAGDTGASGEFFGDEDDAEAAFFGGGKPFAEESGGDGGVAEDRVESLSSDLENVTERVARIQSRVAAIESAMTREHDDVVRSPDGISKK